MGDETSFHKYDTLRVQWDCVDSRYRVDNESTDHGDEREECSNEDYDNPARIVQVDFLQSQTEW